MEGSDKTIWRWGGEDGPEAKFTEFSRENINDAVMPGNKLKLYSYPVRVRARSQCRAG